MGAFPHARTEPMEGDGEGLTRIIMDDLNMHSVRQKANKYSDIFLLRYVASQFGRSDLDRSSIIDPGYFERFGWCSTSRG